MSIRDAFLKSMCCIIIISTTMINCLHSNLQSAIEGSVLSGAIGDAMGRVTEFIRSVDAIYKKYPNGIRSFNDFREIDFWQENGKHTAPYTDDTRMALLVLSELIKARKNNWSLDKTMGAIAHSFVTDMYNKKKGWMCAYRAPGNACIKNVSELEIRIKEGIENWQTTWWNPFKQKIAWWDVQDAKAGGCGSVMHAHPFGLVFADNPQKAEQWAAEHSKLTHGAPIARAACAALAVGTAYAVQHKDPEFILQRMVEAARHYDEITAKMIERAIGYAKNKTVSSAKVFEEFRGFAAHEAIAATAYIFALSSDDLKKTIHLAIHTPGDSDSIASMAGALVGVYTGSAQLPEEWIKTVEDGELFKWKAAEVSSMLN
jgi:ADP-ribosylglycohydrolase